MPVPFYFSGGGKPHPYYIRAWQAGPLSLRLWGRDPAPGRPKGPHTAPGRSRPYALLAPTRGGRSNGLLVGEQAEEDFVTEQPSSFAESQPTVFLLQESSFFDCVQAIAGEAGEWFGKALFKCW